MELQQDIQKLIGEAKNICIIPSQINEPESLPAALALFYTLRELHKNVNLIMGEVPAKFNFLVPPLDFISQPKEFVISIPKNVAEISQVYYEKNEENLKIHLTIDKGNIKKDNISFYFADAKPDLIITLGIQDFQKELQNKLDSFGFLLDSPIINIDSNMQNLKFGKVNIIEEKALSQIAWEIIKSVSPTTPLHKNSANSLMTGLTMYYENFQSQKVTAETFELIAQLMKQGADRAQVVSNLYSPEKKDSPFATTQPLNIVTS